MGENEQKKLLRQKIWFIILINISFTFRLLYDVIMILNGILLSNPQGGFIVSTAFNLLAMALEIVYYVILYIYLFKSKSNFNYKLIFVFFGLVALRTLAYLLYITIFLFNILVDLTIIILFTFPIILSFIAATITTFRVKNGNYQRVFIVLFAVASLIHEGFFMVFSFMEAEGLINLIFSLNLILFNLSLISMPLPKFKSFEPINSTPTNMNQYTKNLSIQEKLNFLFVQYSSGLITKDEYLKQKTEIENNTII